jgi:hypothetical protein
MKAILFKASTSWGFQFEHETFHVQRDKDLNNTSTEKRWDLGASIA